MATTPQENWTNLEGGVSWQLGPWSQWVKAKPGRSLIYSVAMFPRDVGGSLAACAAGQYDLHWRNLANNLTSYGLNAIYLRPGWEMDGNWFRWGAPAGSGKEASFAACFRRIVTAMRQAQPTNQWKFVWNPTHETWPNKAYLDSLWPGDAYVDVLGVDMYDKSWIANGYPYPSTCDATCRLTRQQYVWNNFHGPRIKILRDMAIAHGKTMAFPEWGVEIGHQGHGGGDNPYFIQKMHDFIVDPANRVVFHAYFNIGIQAMDFDCRLTDPTQWDTPTGPTRLPKSAALYKQLFGSGAN